MFQEGGHRTPNKTAVSEEDSESSPDDGNALKNAKGKATFTPETRNGNIKKKVVTDFSKKGLKGNSNKTTKRAAKANLKLPLASSEPPILRTATNAAATETPLLVEDVYFGRIIFDDLQELQFWKNSKSEVWADLNGVRRWALTSETRTDFDSHLLILILLEYFLCYLSKPN
jgi:hypothetical protein